VERTSQRSLPEKLAVVENVADGIRVRLLHANARRLSLLDGMLEIALHGHRIRLDFIRIVAERVYVLAGHAVCDEILARVEIDHLRVGRNDDPFAHETVHRLLPDTRDGEIVRDAELMRGRIEQPVGDLAILFRAMKRLLCKESGSTKHENDQNAFHGTLRATIFTGN